MFASPVTREGREPLPWRAVRFRRVGNTMYQLKNVEWPVLTEGSFVFDRLRLYTPEGFTELTLGVSKAVGYGDSFQVGLKRP
jgi:hypothetical protein